MLVVWRIHKQCFVQNQKPQRLITQGRVSLCSPIHSRILAEFRKVNNDIMENSTKIQLNERSEIDQVTSKPSLEPVISFERALNKMNYFVPQEKDHNVHSSQCNGAIHDLQPYQNSHKNIFNIKTALMDSSVHKSEPSKRNPDISTDNCTSPKVAKYQSRTRDLFKNLYGEEFHIPDEYHRIKPPVIPSFLVVTSCLADNISPVVLGRGSYGRVLKANFQSCLSYGRDIVVKEIFDHRRNVEAIFKEARFLLYLERTGYVPVCFGVVSDGDIEDSYGILQECIGQGITLDSYLWKVRDKSSIHLLDIARQMAEGLKKIHDMGVLINDIKANNVLVNEIRGSLEVKFCDMGLATFRRGRIYRYSSDADEFGYLAPEVRYGGISSFKSDVYSLGYLLELIQDFVQFDHLFPAIDKCLVDNPRKRSDADEVSEIVASIYNRQCLKEWDRTEPQGEHRSNVFVNQSAQGTDISNRKSFREKPTTVASQSDLVKRTSSSEKQETSMEASRLFKGCKRDLKNDAFLSSKITTESCIKRLTEYDADCEPFSDDQESPKRKSFKTKVGQVLASQLNRVSSLTDIADQCRSVMSSVGTPYNRISDHVLDAYVLLLSQNNHHRIFTFWAIIFTLFFTTLFKLFLILNM